VAFQAAHFDPGLGDCEGVLVFRDDALLAVATKLGLAHDDLAGSWIVEALFSAAVGVPRHTFPDLAGLEAWLTGHIA